MHVFQLSPCITACVCRANESGIPHSVSTMQEYEIRMIRRESASFRGNLYDPDNNLHTASQYKTMASGDKRRHSNETTSRIHVEPRKHRADYRRSNADFPGIMQIHLK